MEWKRQSLPASYMDHFLSESCLCSSLNPSELQWKHFHRSIGGDRQPQLSQPVPGELAVRVPCGAEARLLCGLDRTQWGLRRGAS